MKKFIFTIFVISIMTGFLITCTLPRANAGSKGTGQAQKSMDSVAELSTPKSNVDGIELSVAHIIEKAEQGDIYAQYDLALMYAEGSRVSQDMDQAASLLLEAANRGHLKAQRYLASLYENGKWGFSQDMDKAEYWSNLRGRLPSSATGDIGQEDGSKKGLPFSGFALFAAFIIFALIAIAFIINKKIVKTVKPTETETITLDDLESQTDQAESDISFDDLSDS